MKIWRGFTLTLWVLIMALCITVITVQLSAQRTVLDPVKAKQWISAGDTYPSIRDNVLASKIYDVVRDKYPDNTLIDKPLIKNTLAETLPQTTLSTRFDPVLTAVYKWLDSKEPDITFSVPLTDTKDTFFKSLEKNLGMKIASLPECEEPTYSPQDDLLTKQCLSPYVTSKEATSVLMNEIRSNDSPLGSELTANSLGLNALSTQVKNIPDYVSYFWVARLIAIAVLVYLVLLVLISRKIVGVVAVGGAILLAILTTFMTTQSVARFDPRLEGDYGGAVTAIVGALKPHFVSQLNAFSLYLLGVGIILVLSGIGLLYKRRNK